MHLRVLFRLNVSCALLPMVSSPFASPWGVGNFEVVCLGCAESLALPKGTEISLSQEVFFWILFGFWSLVLVFHWFLFFFSFNWIERQRTSGWSLLAVMSDWQHGVDWLLAEYCSCRLRLDLLWCRWRAGAKGLCLARHLRSGETSRLSSRDPMASRVKCGPHGDKERLTTRVCTRGLRRFTTRPSVYLVEPQNQDQTLIVRRRNLGMSRSFGSGSHMVGSQGLRREEADCGKGVAVRWRGVPLNLFAPMGFVSQFKC
jgi:hypothetical protein